MFENRFLIFGGPFFHRFSMHSWVDVASFSKVKMGLKVQEHDKKNDQKNDAKMPAYVDIIC